MVQHYPHRCSLHEKSFLHDALVGFRQSSLLRRRVLHVFEAVLSFLDTLPRAHTAVCPGFAAHLRTRAPAPRLCGPTVTKRNDPPLPPNEIAGGVCAVVVGNKPEAVRAVLGLSLQQGTPWSPTYHFFARATYRAHSLCDSRNPPVACSAASRSTAASGGVLGVCGVFDTVALEGKQQARTDVVQIPLHELTEKAKGSQRFWYLLSA